GDQWLVDETAGAIPASPRRFGMQAQAMSGTAVSGLEMEADTVMNLIARVQTTAANQQMQTMSLATSMNVPSFNDTGDGGSGTNGFYSDSFNFHPDYGTNLWIANFARSSGNATGIISN